MSKKDICFGIVRIRIEGNVGRVWIVLRTVLVSMQMLMLALVLVLLLFFVWVLVLVLMLVLVVFVKLEMFILMMVRLLLYRFRYPNACVSATSVRPVGQDIGIQCNEVEQCDEEEEALFTHYADKVCRSAGFWQP